MIKVFKNTKTSISNKVRLKIRSKAMSNAQSRIIASGGNIDKLSSDDLEVLVKEEEDKLVAGYKDKGIMFLLALVGLDILS
jgi:hypothetical protein